ncbi:MAG: hydrolase [Candidatus Altiarchaeales archaeon]|nr:hydrolase [Candidatus Altiarchaeales archaeon]
MKQKLGFLDRNDTVLIVVDVQEKFRPVVFEFDRVVRNVRKIVEGFRVLNVPVVVTEQYPAGLGTTVSEVKQSLGKFKPVEKNSFSCFGDKNFVKELKKLKRKNIVLVGIEAHVCVFKTALDALSKGFNVHIPVDCVSSIHKSDLDVAVKRLMHSGCFMASSEMILFQLLDNSKEKEFKQLSGIVKSYR